MSQGRHQTLPNPPQRAECLAETVAEAVDRSQSPDTDPRRMPEKPALAQNQVPWPWAPRAPQSPAGRQHKTAAAHDMKRGRESGTCARDNFSQPQSGCGMLPCRCRQRAGRGKLKSRKEGGHRPEPQSLPEGRERHLGTAVRPRRLNLCPAADGGKVNKTTQKQTSLRQQNKPGSRTAADAVSPPRTAVNADVLRMAGSFAGHDRTQTHRQRFPCSRRRKREQEWVQNPRRRRWDSGSAGSCCSNQRGCSPGLRQNKSGNGHHSGLCMVPGAVGICTSMHHPSRELHGGERSN